jgi:hypothetical protein
VLQTKNDRGRCSAGKDVAGNRKKMSRGVVFENEVRFDLSRNKPTMVRPMEQAQTACLLSFAGETKHDLGRIEEGAVIDRHGNHGVITIVSPLDLYQ